MLAFRRSWSWYGASGVVANGRQPKFKNHGLLVLERRNGDASDALWKERLFCQCLSSQLQGYCNQYGPRDKNPCLPP